MTEQNPDEAGEGLAPNLQQAVAKASDRIQEIVESTDELAGKIRAEAEAEAEAYVASRKAEADSLVADARRDLDTLTKGLADRAERLERQLGDLAAAMRDTAEWVEGAIPSVSDVASEESAEPADPGEAEAASADASVPESEITFEPPAVPDTPAAIPEEAVLRATQMAVAGSDREAIEQVLLIDYGITDPAPVVVKLFAEPDPETGPRVGKFVGPSGADPSSRTG